MQRKRRRPESPRRHQRRPEALGGSCLRLPGRSASGGGPPRRGCVRRSRPARDGVRSTRWVGRAGSRRGVRAGGPRAPELSATSRPAIRPRVKALRQAWPRLVRAGCGRSIRSRVRGRRRARPRAAAGSARTRARPPRGHRRRCAPPLAAGNPSRGTGRARSSAPPTSPPPAHRRNAGTPRSEHQERGRVRRRAHASFRPPTSRPRRAGTACPRTAAASSAASFALSSSAAVSAASASSTAVAAARMSTQVPSGSSSR